ncbi:MAG: EAL domain-containing protein [Bacilli bacterium]|nr:EAL domain-containing protein [Bacilli bacterium]
MKTRKRLLVIEPSEQNRAVLRDILQNEYDIVEASNGQEGFEVLSSSQDHFSLILLDLHMPVMDGYEFLELFSKEPKFKTIPVIATSSVDSDKEEIACFEKGASDLVKKPYNPEILKRRIASLIRLNETSILLNKVERDVTTGAYSKESFLEYCTNVIRSEPDGSYDLAVMEMESFEILLERYGRDKCEAFARSIVKNVTAALGDILIGRVDDSQIAMLLKHISFEEHKKFMGYCMLADYEVPIPNVVVNCGVYPKIDREANMNSVLKFAAMPLAGLRNHYGLYIAEFDDAMRNKVEHQAAIVASSQKAIQEKQFKVYYQPKFDPESECVGGAEALVRWIHPEMGFLSPAEFIPLFETNGFIYEVDKYVLETVCSDLRRWLDEDKTMIPVSVNISQADFDQPDLANIITGIVDKYELPHALIHLEITESANASDKGKKIEIINALKEREFIIELDDFGTGYSTFASVAELPIDIMKIDMSLVRNMFEPKHEAILRSIIYTAARLGFDTVAEGVETQEQASALKEMCGAKVHLLIQGYFYSKPLPVEDYEKYAFKS